LIEIGSKTAEKNSAQTNKQTDNRQTNRHYENNGHLAVNQKQKTEMLRRNGPVTKSVESVLRPE